MQQRGQSTVELALCLPLLLLLLACVTDIARMGLAQTRLWHAAREGARIAAVDPDASGVRGAVREAGVGDVRVTVAPAPEFRIQGEAVTVVLRRRASAGATVLRPLLSKITLTARATFRIEVP